MYIQIVFKQKHKTKCAFALLSADILSVTNDIKDDLLTHHVSFVTAIRVMIESPVVDVGFSLYWLPLQYPENHI